jgi:hypothetical protein
MASPWYFTWLRNIDVGLAFTRAVDDKQQRKGLAALSTRRPACHAHLNS